MSRAGVVGGIATEWTQLANNLQLVNQYIRQGEELRQKILMVADMARNTANLPFQVFGPVMADIGRLAGVVQNGRALAYSMANLDAEFRNRFRGYQYNARTGFETIGTGLKPVSIRHLERSAPQVFRVSNWRANKRSSISCEAWRNPVMVE